MLFTVITGPPERSRTSSPRWNDGAVRSCIAVTEAAGSENAGMDKGALSATASASAAALGLHFVKAGMPKLHFSRAAIHDPVASGWIVRLEKAADPAAFFHQVHLAA
jgi:hypothetical protein